MIGLDQPSCIDCGLCGCADNSQSYPPFCVTKSLSDDDRKALLEDYQENDVFAVMNAASETMSRAFDEQWCRVEETMFFARKRGAQRLGIAVCSGLIEEGRLLARVLRANEFEVYGIACKAGALAKAELGVADSCCDYGSISCDPLLQAKMLNEAQTDLNIIVGLCVGHDILFMQRSKAPCTTLVTKDRALVHNPAAALHAIDSASIYNRMLRGSFGMNAVR